LLEALVGLFETGRHLIERDGQAFDLVARAELDRLVELADSDARRAFLQHADGRDHASGEEEAGQNRQQKAQHEDDDASDDGSAQGRVGVCGGTLHEYEPAQGRDGSMRGEHAAAAQAVGDDRSVPGITRRRTLRPRRLYLGQAGEIAEFPQHPAVRVGHEPIARVHHVGIAPGAHVDLRHQLDHGPEAHLGRRHLHRVLADRHRERDEGLCFVLQIDGTPVRLAPLRLEELGRSGEVLLAARDIRVETGDPQLLLAREVEVA